MSSLRCAVVLQSLLLIPCLAQQPKAELRWHDARKLTLQGQGWTDVAGPFHRFPARAESIVRKPVWELSIDSAGLAVRFVTSAPTIAARWKVHSETLALPHMPATGVSGLDLYVRAPGGGWRWVANGRPKAVANEQVLIENWPGGRREYMVYLPLYNGTDSLEIGAPQDAAVEPAPPYPAGVRPAVFYGSSITQGGCAARPGMAYPSIVGRMLDIPTVNLGFSGNGKSEPEIAKLLAELDPSVYVYDSLPNQTLEEAKVRVEPFLRTLREAHPKTPILLMENVLYTNLELSEERRKVVEGKNAVLREVYQRLRKEGDRNVHYVAAAGLLGADFEGTVDGTHPTDLGFVRMAEAISRALKPLVRGGGRGR